MGIVQSRRFKTFMFGLLTVLSSVVVGYGIAMTTRGSFTAPLSASDVVVVPVTDTPLPRRTALLAAGGSQEQTPLASETSAMLDTPTPADTPAALESPTPSQTAAVLQATALTIATSQPSAQATSTATNEPLKRFVNESFDSSASGWLVRDGTRSSSGYRDGRYRLTLSGQTDLGVSSAVQASSYQLSADVMIRKGSAGLVFLSVQPTTFYRFVITNEGTYAVQAHQQDATSTSDLVGWRESEALKRGPAATNRLRLERTGAIVRCYANEQLLVELTLPDGAFTGQYGFALAADDGRAEASFDNLIGEYLPQP